MSLRPGRLAFALLAPLVACAAARPTPVHDAAPRAELLFPLAVGNRWTYQVQFLGAKQLLSVAIVSRADSEFVDNRGTRYRLDRAGLRDAQRYLIREPVETGKGWQSVIGLDATESYRVASVGESADVPAGHFEGCVRIEGREPSRGGGIQLAEQTYCPHVGLVRVTTYEERGGARSVPQWREELVAYRLTSPQDVQTVASPPEGK